ncbi:MAG TPA: methytransferase partner Trm112 [Methanomassiliicoccales archaeon]|nr:methytransferase partner Trm112 [Methanomassiliicoccales archaeon]
MKQDLMNILACPLCKSHPLALKVAKEEVGEIIEGTLTCNKCSIDYPIDDGIPNLIPPKRN